LKTKVFVLCHPQSVALFEPSAYNIDDVEFIKISCGTTKMINVNLSEANDFYPTYASWNSALFESSVILTVWKHAKELLDGCNVAFLHTDIRTNHNIKTIFKYISDNIANHNIGLTINSDHKKAFKDMVVKPHPMFNIDSDPMFTCEFDSNIKVWDLIAKYDKIIYEYALRKKPQMIYAHQFACNYDEFIELGGKLMTVASKMTLDDIGLWTPHVFERLIGLYLSHNAILTTSFLHYASSSCIGPGDHKLYGPRPRKYYIA